MTIRLLIVEDTEHVRTMLARVLEIQGFDVVGQAAGAAEALTLAEETDPDVVVMDYKMPETDGITATRRLREQDANRAVIMYSAYLTDELRSRAEEAGVLACVPKVSGVEALAREIAAAALTLEGGEA